MGRYCCFSNGFEYKFWFAVQPSGFGFLEEAGVVCSDEEPYVCLSTDVIENDGEHHFCDANCDKPIKNPKEMLTVGNCLFCDEECQKNFSGGEPNTPHDLDELEGKYKFLKWFEDSGLEPYQPFLVSEYRGIEDDWCGKYITETNEYNFRLYVDGDGLLKYITDFGFTVPYWNLFSKDKAGTKKLYHFLVERIRNEEGDKEKKADYCLACILYHMSLYDDDIGGSYEC